MTREHHPHDHQTHETRVRFYHKLVTADQATKQGWMATWNSLDNAHRQSIIENGELSGLTAALRGVGLSAEDVGHLSGGGSLYDPGAVGFASTEEALAKFGIAS